MIISKNIQTRTLTESETPVAVNILFVGGHDAVFTSAVERKASEQLGCLDSEALKALRTASASVIIAIDGDVHEAHKATKRGLVTLAIESNKESTGETANACVDGVLGFLSQHLPRSSGGSRETVDSLRTKLGIDRADEFEVDPDLKDFSSDASDEDGNDSIVSPHLRAFNQKLANRPDSRAFHQQLEKSLCSRYGEPIPKADRIREIVARQPGIATDKVDAEVKRVAEVFAAL